ncbi:thioredoxin domain-containing protein [Candidatus Gottesmanbacteria bacterium]|nr:thioredoxin domain-containing protein [Candidatus Gottesmanbacteria bacterium]
MVTAKQASPLGGKLLIVIGIVIVLALALFFYRSQSAQNPSRAPSQDLLIREDSPTVGSQSAQVILVEFVDYQCPACAYMHPAVKQLLSDNQGKLRLVVRYWPLENQHKNAKTAAEAAEAASEQGKFWEMHDLLLSRQKDWEESETAIDIFVRYAQELNLNVERFRESIQNNKFEAKIKRDVEDAEALNISGIPQFFVNGNSVGYMENLDEFKSKVESYITK